MKVGAAGSPDKAEGELLRGDQGGALVDEGPDRGDGRRADDLSRRDESAEPVGDVDDVLPGDARKEILVAARDSDDLVRQDRAEDEGDVVLDDGLDRKIGCDGKRV